MLFKNICRNTCGWKSTLKCVKCCLKTENGCLKSLTKHPLGISFIFFSFRLSYGIFFFFFLIFIWNFFQGLKIFLGIFIRGCEFKRIYILVTKLTTFLYIYFKGCVNYFSRVVLIILKVLIKSSNSYILVFIWTNFSNPWKKRVEIAHVVCSANR